jgi:hypothetical protein
MKSHHLKMSIRGALLNWKDKDFKGVLSHNGRTLSPREAKEQLLIELSNGHEVIPCCNESDCPDFDYSGAGCPGHEVKV